MNEHFLAQNKGKTLFLDRFEKDLLKKRKYYCFKHDVKLGISGRCWECIREEDKIVKDDLAKRDRKWSREVKKRDKVCRLCSKTSKESRLQAHHIKSRSKYPELRFDLENGITLCLECHAEQHPNISKLILSHKDRAYFFQS